MYLLKWGLIVAFNKNGLLVKPKTTQKSINYDLQIIGVIP